MYILFPSLSWLIDILFQCTFGCFSYLNSDVSAFILRNGLPDHVAALFLTLKVISLLVCVMTVTSYIPPVKKKKKVPFLNLTPAFLAEKAMAPHFSTLAYKIPWTEEPGRLQSMESQRVGHDWATSLSLFTFMHWRRKWQPTPVFLPGESQGWGSLMGCRLPGRTESDTTEAT